MKPLTVVVIFAIVVVSCHTAFPEKGSDAGVRLVQIIIKVEPDVIVMPEGTYKAPLSEVEINSEKLKELNRTFNLISMERMFARKKSLEEVRMEFPDREARAPEEAEVPDLENIFLLKFPELIDPRVIIEEYEKIEDVVYAEEDKTVGIF